MKPCLRCGGSGEEPDDEGIGREMRRRRVNAGVTLRQVASRVGLSATYISDLERGNRHWRADIRAAFVRALGEVEEETGNG